MGKFQVKISADIPAILLVCSHFRKGGEKWLLARMEQLDSGQTDVLKSVGRIQV
jgi:hypothetical protein